MTAAREYGILPAYEIEQLIEIYEASGRSCDLETLKATARKLYPVNNEEDEPPLYLCQGSFVGWVDADGYMHKAKYTLGTPHDAEDVAMSAWVRVANNFTTAKECYLESPKNFSGYIAVIVKNLAIDESNETQENDGVPGELGCASTG